MEKVGECEFDMNKCHFILLVIFINGNVLAKDFQIGTILTNFSDIHYSMAELFNYQYIGAAVPIAFNKAKYNYSLLRNENLTYFYEGSQCDEKLALDLFIQLRQIHQIDVLLGPQCSSECIVTGILASQWDVPIISHSCSRQELSNSKRFNTFLRTSGSSSVDNALVMVLRHFNWSHIALVRPTDVNSYWYVAEAIRLTAEEFDISIAEKSQKNEEDVHAEDILDHIKRNARSKYAFI